MSDPQGEELQEAVRRDFPEVAEMIERLGPPPVSWDEDGGPP